MDFKLPVFLLTLTFVSSTVNGCILFILLTLHHFPHHICAILLFIASLHWKLSSFSLVHFLLPCCQEGQASLGRTPELSQFPVSVGNSML